MGGGGDGEPREAGPGNRLIRSLFLDVSREGVYPGAGMRRPALSRKGRGGRGGDEGGNAVGEAD